MLGYLGNVVYLFFIALVLSVTKYIVSSFGYRRQLKDLGCQAPVKAFQWDPIFGTDWARAEQRGTQASSRLEFLQGEFAKYGKTFQHTGWGVPTLDTMDARNFQTIATSIDEFTRGRISSVLKPLVGVGVFFADGNEWRYHRHLIKPVFARSQISDLDAFESHAKLFFALIPRDGSTVDLQPLFKKLFLDTSTEFLFGESFNSLTPAMSAQGTAFTKAMDHTLRWMLRPSSWGPLERFRQLDPEVARDIELVHSFPNKNVDRILSSQKAGLSEKASPKHYVFLEDVVKETQDRDELRGIALDLFIGARDAPAIAITNVFFCLARNPRVWTKLQQEVVALGERRLTFELLKSMTYLRYVINETLRLFSPARLITRTCSKDTVLPAGGGADGNLPILVKKGTVIRGYFGAMHRDPTIWGDDAEEFRPERWENFRPGWAYVPFSGGPRICPAQQMVLLEVSWLTVKIMQQFKSLENRDPVLEWVGETNASIQSKNGAKVGLIPSQIAK